MGIRGLLPLLRRVTNGAGIKRIGIETLRGKRLAVDSSMLMYRMFAVSSSDSESIGRIMRRVRQWRDTCGLDVVMVFDGQSPEAKTATLEQRRKRSHEMMERAEVAAAAGDTEQAGTLSQRARRLSADDKRAVLQRLEAVGVRCVQADGEAEKMCVEMCVGGLVDAVASDDTDVLALGAPRVIRGLFACGDSDGEVDDVDTQAIVTSLELTREQFVDLCILCGCDYCPSIKFVGPVAALRLVREFGNIEAIIVAIRDGKGPKRAVVPDDFGFVEARSLFILSPPPLQTEAQPVVDPPSSGDGEQSQRVESDNKGG